MINSSFLKKIKKFLNKNFVNNLIIIISIFIFTLGIIKLLNLEPIQLNLLKTSAKRLILWLPIFYSILFLGYIGRYLRWRILLSSLSIGKFCLKEILFWFSGFSLTATPGKLGEISRVQLMGKYLNYPKKKLLPIFFIERFFDFISVSIWIFILSPNLIIFNFKNLVTSSFFLFFLTITLVFLILLVNKYSDFLKNKFQNLNFNLNLSKINLIKTSIYSIFTTIYFWGIEALILWLLVYLLSPNSISISSAIYIYFISGILGVISGLPGGLGVNEVTATILLQQQGISGTLALIISILRRLITIWSISGLSILISIRLKKIYS